MGMSEVVIQKRLKVLDRKLHITVILWMSKVDVSLKLPLQ